MPSDQPVSNASPTRWLKPLCHRLLMMLSCLIVWPMASQAQTDSAVRIGLDVRMPGLPMLIARERGYFERHGVDVDLRVLKPADNAVELLDTDEIDLLAMTGSRLLETRELGLDLSGILILATSLGAEAVLAAQSISDVRQLRGKQVALQPGSASELVLAAALSRKGLSLADIEVVEESPLGAIELLLNGSVEAAASHAPWLPEGSDAQPLRTLASGADQRGLVHDLLSGQTSWLENNREALQGVIRAWNDAIIYLRRNPAAAQQLIADVLDLPAPAIAAGFKGVELHDVAENMQLLRGQFQQEFARMGDVLADNRDNRSVSFSNANRVLLLSPLRRVSAQH